VRLRFPLPFLLAMVFLSLAALAQSPNGTLSGLVLDPSGRAIAGAEIQIVNDVTGVRYPGTTNSEGIYAVPNLPPGPYRIQVSKTGFKTLIKPDVVLNVQSAVAINFTLPIGARSETVTVEGGAPLVNAESGSVSTVIGQNLVESLPLNGRSFNTLLQLTPGVVIAPSSSVSQGQFSIAGQRTSANNFLVDGVSANFGVSPDFGLGTSGTGAAQAFSALGGTSSLVSVEALQEFRVETSSSAPEFGRSPGGQIILTTRAGTNQFHGGLYEYFRNNVLDANDWFANADGQPRAPERHNDFGGFLGGPIQSDKTFFFISYEGARLRQPQTTVIQVPSAYARSSASADLAPYLNAYPRPDDPTVVAGVYTDPFTGSYSNPSTLNAGSIRMDHTFGSKWSVFGRYNEAPSESAVRSNSLSEVDVIDVGTRTLTFAITATLRPTVSNTFRGNYSLQKSGYVSHIDSFGGATPPDISLLAPGLENVGNITPEFGTFDTASYFTGPSARNRGRQLNFADDFALTRGTHQIKIGADYRAIRLSVVPPQFSTGLLATSVQDLLTTSQVLVFGVSSEPSQFLTQSASVYGQDVWRVTPRLVLTYGLRWELSPAPGARGNTTLASWTNVNDPSAIALAPEGTELWHTELNDMAPRIGLAYRVTNKGDLVLRAGWGLYYDAASDAVGYLASSFPNNVSSCCSTISLPLSDIRPYLPPISLDPPYPANALGFDPNLKNPRSYQWNVAMEKSFAEQQAISLTYVGQAGRDLLRQVGLNQPNANFDGAFLLTQNNAVSNYQAMQLQYRRPLAERLEALLNYTWSHSLDNASNDVVPAVSGVVVSGNDYSSSSFDVRHSFSGGVTYALPAISKSGLIAQLTGNWSLQTVVVARSGFPFNAAVGTFTIGGAQPRPDLVPGQPIWISDPAAGGGKSLNEAAFSIPSTVRQGTEPRNDINGFGLTQVDLSLDRKFPLTEKVAIRFHADAFNVLNHPNFANPFAYVGIGETFLQSPSMTNQQLGGLNPLFQEGGPRSLQLSLKLDF
jgi:Carboxypeptidase regulatory-like domain/TonB-dependent Receptor Plug Domain